MEVDGTEEVVEACVSCVSREGKNVLLKDLGTTFLNFNPKSYNPRTDQILSWPNSNLIFPQQDMFFTARVLVQIKSYIKV